MLAHLGRHPYRPAHMHHLVIASGFQRMKSSSETFTVLSGDDHPIVRSGVRLILATAAEFNLVAEAGNATETFAAVERYLPDLLILDLWMGGNDGLELIRRIMVRHPAARILVYSVNDERIFGPRTFKAGAAGYLMKQHGLEELLTALRVIAAGERYLSRELAVLITSTALDTTRSANNLPLATLSSLTDRELQVLRLIGTGLGSAAIAQRLGISARTVGAHRENIKNKMRLPDAAALARQAAALTEARLL